MLHKKINEWTLFFLPFILLLLFFWYFKSMLPHSLFDTSMWMEQCISNNNAHINWHIHIITDILIHSYYCILVKSKLVFCHFVFSSKSKIDYWWDTKNSSRNILKIFYSPEVILKGCQWLILMKASKRKALLFHVLLFILSNFWVKPILCWLYILYPL